MQEVHTLTRLGVPPTVTRLLWMFGFQRRGVRRWENETFLPKPGPLPQMSQTEATGFLHRSRCMTTRRRSKTGPGSRQSLSDARPGREPPMVIAAVVVVARIVGARFYAGRCDLAARTADRVAGSADRRPAGRGLRPAHGGGPAA